MKKSLNITFINPNAEEQIVQAISGVIRTPLTMIRGYAESIFARIEVIDYGKGSIFWVELKL